MFELQRQSLANQTVIHDLESNQAIFLLQGVVVLPVGSEVELVDPNINVKVERVRLLAGGSWGGPTVCLDVRTTEEWRAGHSATS